MSIPEGATHVVADIYSLRDEQKEMNNKYPYRKKYGDLWLAFVDYEWVNVWLPDPKRYQKIDKPWSGPEDGLPPLGVEVDFDYQDHPQGSGKVLFYGNEFCIVQNTNGGEPYEQVALIEDYSFKCLHKVGSLLDKRETAIRELMDIAGVDCRVTAARLVDAGFKREVV